MDEPVDTQNIQDLLWNTAKRGGEMVVRYVPPGKWKIVIQDDTGEIVDCQTELLGTLDEALSVIDGLAYDWLNKLP